MMKYLAALFTTLLVTVSICVFARPAQAFDLFHRVCNANTSSSTLCQEKNKPQTNDCNAIFGRCGILMKATSIISIGVGAASVIMIVIGGFKFVLSQGDASNITSARNTVLYAVVGLVVAVLAQVIIVFVINRI